MIINSAADRAAQRAAKPKTGKVEAFATCYCGYNLNVVSDTPACDGEGYDNNHDGGRGGYRVKCDGCGDWFHLERQTVTDLQHVALLMLGEA